MSFNYYSIRTWITVSQEDNYIIDFPFIRREDIVVYLDGVHLDSEDIEWQSDSQFKILAPVLTNQKVIVRRFTEQGVRLADYHDGSTLVEEDLNIVTRQLLYLIQELTDYKTAGIDPETIPGQDGDPNDPNGDPEFITNIINEILASQVFQNLIELIALTDINAEAIMQNSLSNHEEWSLQRLLDEVVSNYGIDLADFGIQLGVVDAQIIDLSNTVVTNESATATALDGIAVRFQDSESSILNLQTAFADAQTASATLTQQLLASIADNEALILDVQGVLVTDISALAATVHLLDVEVDDATSRIGVIEQAYVDENGAIALIQTEIDVWYQDWFPNEDWESIISTSSYINGVETTVSENGAEITGITSYLVGSTGSFANPETGSPMRSLANLQTTVSGHTDSISAGIDFRNAMFAFFDPGGDANSMVAAMEERWQVYADEESSLVERTLSLEANQQPIFFRATAPDPTAQEFEGGNFVNGFPVGSLWHNTEFPTRLITYFWHDSNTQPYAQVAGDDFISFKGITGMWARLYDMDIYTQGASIQELTTLYNNLGGTGGIIETTIQALVGDDISAISETMESWFDNETGQMYSGWQVRINQYNGGTGTPVISGIGLGMENDPENPEADSISSLLVMADRFAIIKPPTAEELEGELTSENVFIPFIVNTNGIEGEPEVIVNASMFVKNTFSANDGYAGRFTFTEMNSVGLPTTVDGDGNASGQRLVLAGDGDENYNTAVGQGTANPWGAGNSTPQKYWIWAGDGDMNHNNATFYVDTDGNAVFRGEVLADNISGDVSNIHNVDVTGGATVPNGSSGWHVVATSPEYSPVGARGRTPSVVVNVDMFGEGSEAGRARIEGRVRIGSSWSGWVVIAEAPISTPIGTTLTLAGTMSKTTGSVQLRSSIRRQQKSGGAWQYPSSSYMKGVLQMLA